MVIKSDQAPCHPLDSLPSCCLELAPGGQPAPGPAWPISPALGAACTHCPCPGCSRLWAPSYPRRLLWGLAFGDLPPVGLAVPPVP